VVLVDARRGLELDEFDELGPLQASASPMISS
jgi:hypothetical protein